MTKAESDSDRALISLPSRRDMMRIQSALDALTEANAGSLSQDEHGRLMQVMGDVQHHLRRCVRYEDDEESAERSTDHLQSDLLPTLRKAQADIVSLEQNVRDQAARVLKLCNQVPTKIGILEREFETVLAEVNERPADQGAEVQSSHKQTQQPIELAKLTSALPEMQRSIMKQKVKMQSHLEVLRQKRGVGGRREHSLLPDSDFPVS